MTVCPFESWEPTVTDLVAVGASGVESVVTDMPLDGMKPAVRLLGFTRGCDSGGIAADNRGPDR